MAAPARSKREYLALVWGGFDARRGQGRRADRPRSAPSGENGGPSEERGRHAATHWRLEEGLGPAQPRRLPARDRPHPPDPGAYGLDRSSVVRRFGLWFRASRPRPRCSATAARSALAALGTSGFARFGVGLRASRDRRDAPVREPAAERFCEVAQSITSGAGSLTPQSGHALHETISYWRRIAV